MSRKELRRKVNEEARNSFISRKALAHTLRVRKMCMDKKHYESELEAESYGRLYNYQNNEHKQYRPYFCPRCLRWHLSTQPYQPKLNELNA